LPLPPQPSASSSPAPMDAGFTPRILLMVAGKDAALAYLSRLGELGAACDPVENMAALVAKLRTQAYNGIVLDVPTLIKDKSYDKRLITEVMDFFPLLRARSDAAGGRILALSPSGSLAPHDVLADFVLTRAAAFPARRIRASARVRLCLNVVATLLAPEATEAAPGVPTGTRRSCVLDVSAGGCFVWDIEPPATGQRVRIEFSDRSGNPSALARVIWRLPWGERPALPGAGLEFEDLSGEMASWMASLGVKAFFT